MASFYANENFPLPATLKLRGLGHDVLTVQEAGKGDQAFSDAEVLAYATNLGRAVLTFNRKHFFKLHASGTAHAGIIACTVDSDFERLARAIHAAVMPLGSLRGIVIRVNRPS